MNSLADLKSHRYCYNIRCRVQHPNQHKPATASNQSIHARNPFNEVYLGSCSYCIQSNPSPYPLLVTSNCKRFNSTNYPYHLK